MASRGRGRRGRPRGASQEPPFFFYQEAFIEAMGAAIATATQADAARGQGDASNLQRFKAHHPMILLGLSWLHSSLRVSPRSGGSGSRLPGTWRL